MTLQKPIRELIKSWLEKGFKPPEIVRLLKGRCVKATCTGGSSAFVFPELKLELHMDDQDPNAQSHSSNMCVEMS